MRWRARAWGAVLVLSVLAMPALAAPSLGPLGGAVLAAAGQNFDGLALVFASPSTGLTWAVWGSGGASQIVRLALLKKSGAVASPLWSTSWPDAYEPSMRSIPEWQSGGLPVLAVTMQFGAAAEQIDLYGLDDQNHPVQLAEQTAAAIGWSISPAGSPVLVLYNTPETALVPSCFSWAEGSHALAPVPCDR